MDTVSNQHKLQLKLLGESNSVIRIEEERCLYPTLPSGVVNHSVAALRNTEEIQVTPKRSLGISQPLTSEISDTRMGWT